MPAFATVILVIIAVCTFITIAYMKRKKSEDPSVGIAFSIAVFAISSVSLVISVVLMVNMGIYVDELGSSPVLITGGWFWLNMYWLRFFMLFVLTFMSGLNMVSKLRQVRR